MRVVIIGSSGHSKMIIDILEENNTEIIGLIDDYEEEGNIKNGYKILGDINSIKNYKMDPDIEYFIAIGDNWTRKIVSEKIFGILPDAKFCNVISKNSKVSKNVDLGMGNVIMPSCVVNTGSKIGNFCIINSNATIEHDNILKDFVSIAPGVTIGGNVEVGQFTAISIGSSIIHNISIGDYNIIGAGSVVVRSIEDSNSIYFGSPAKFQRKREKEEKYL